MDLLNIVWFKRDLRVENHLAISNASKCGPTLALFCWEPAMWRAEDASIAQQAFVGECLRSLRRALDKLGIHLHISSMGIIETLNFIAKKQTISGLYSHEETGNLISFAIDQSVAMWCKTNRAIWHQYPQNGVVRGLKNRDEWHGLWEAHMRAPCVSLSGVNLPTATKYQPILTLPKRPIVRAVGEDKQYRQSGGREEALAVLNSFLNDRSRHYRGGISSPIKAAAFSSRLSPYLAWGCLSMREVVQASRMKVAQLQAEGLSHTNAFILGLNSFESRLHWHCHFMQKLESEPTLEIQHMHSAHVGMRDEKLNHIDSQRRLNAWCKGETGWPLVDACLAMLKQQGWVNFRMRAMLMSTASYLLWLHWRQTGLHLAREFVDYEPGIHWPQVQMQSGSTGMNTLRIYNPIKQAQDQDPRGQFVRKWIPALNRVPDAWIFEPYLMPNHSQMQYGCVLEKDYPLPLLDIQQAMRYAKSQVAIARKNHQDQQETRAIIQKHGSRLYRRKKTTVKKIQVRAEQTSMQKTLF
jgi:deoxyribodipyrimidine photo-lyase